MNLLTVVIIAAMIATLIALGFGLGAMGRGGEFDQKHSHHLMFARIGSQAITFLLLLLALYLASIGKVQ